MSVARTKAEQSVQKQLEERLAAKLDGDLRTDPASRAMWATDASIYKRSPVAVVVAKSEEDVRETMLAASELGLSVTPRGTGTSLAGQATAPGISLDTSLLNEVHEMDVEKRRVVVGPGMVQGELNALVEPHGLVFGADTSTSDVATLGGMIGNNSAGMRSVVYGTTADQILSLRCVLPDGETVEFYPMPRRDAERKSKGEGAEARLLRGALDIGERYSTEIKRRFPRLIRRVSGYGINALVDPDELDLTRIICGSEGTLAVVTRAELVLKELPEKRSMASFEFDSLAASARATVALLEMNPSAIELLDDVAINIARENATYSRYTKFVRGEPKAVLLTEWSGTEEEVEEIFGRLDAIAEGIGATSAVRLSPEEQTQTVKLRKSTLPILLGTSDDAKPVAFVEDAAVPPDRLEEFVVRFEEIVAKNDTWACFYGHASVGTLHVRPALDTGDPAGVVKMRRIAESVADLVAELGGSISGEHGDGLSRSEFLEKMYGREVLRAFEEVKNLFDPERRLNPDVIVGAKPMDTQLRIGPERTRLPIATGLDFRSQGGFAKAVELCNGSGFCRKKDGGTMCPSYMATLDEQDSTRARANMLRAVIEGTLPKEELTGERMRETFDLCVGCKACKTECPSQVDVAAMKTEVLYQTGKRKGFSLKQRGAGHIRKTLQTAAKYPKIFNLITGSFVAKLGASLVGIDRRRTLSQVTERVFSERFPELPQGDGTGKIPEVALFNDTWNEYQRPEIGEGAVRILAAAGARVRLPEVVCCGRPMLSEGLVDEARENAKKNLDLLSPLIDAGIPLVGLEPSCILTMREDYRKLLPEDERVEKLSGLTRLFEEVVIEMVDGGAELPLKSGGEVLLHGHCHQKSLVGTAPVERMLALGGADVSTVDSGCCGMAGLFGYEKSHYEVSMKMGERKLFPAVRDADGRVVVAAGTSCREQILDGTEARAIHPAEYLASRLEGAQNIPDERNSESNGDRDNENDENESGVA